MTLPVVDPPAERTGEARVAGVLLAAGTSTRFGDANKLLELVDGEPLVRRSAAYLLDAGLDSVRVVVGYEADRVRDALDGLPVAFVENPEYESGQASSVRAAVESLGDADAAVFALGDMPHVDSDSVRALVAAFEAGAGSALAAGVDGERGNPVLFAREHFPALAATDGDTGGRQVLLDADDAVLVATGDPGVVRDVDHPEDLA
jgi:molybdenum cofactor cytidylyltransferase